MDTINETTIVWFRQDLRIEDNEALKSAIEKEKPIVALYIFDEEDKKEWKIGGASKWWLHHSLISLEKELKTLNLRLMIRKGKSLEVLKEVIKEAGAKSLFWNRCYEPSAIKRDSEIKSTLKSEDIIVLSFGGALLFEPWDILNKQNKPFQVFTPFWNHCLKSEIQKPIVSSLKKAFSHDIKSGSIKDLKLLPTLDWDKGFKANFKPGAPEAKKVLNSFIEEPILSYLETRDRPDIEGVSKLSPYLHFGEITPRMIWMTITEKYRENRILVDGFLRQIGWREFAHHLLYHFPRTQNEPLRKEFSHFPWKNDAFKLKAWQKGLTGYPLVDAGMRQLWTTGWMHNRVRMVVGSFLVKDLLIDWHEGAKWFFDCLLDADLANNTLGWQWVSGCGADAAPYFRIFNPTTQAEKFDPEGFYIRKWVPELKNLETKWIHKPFDAPIEALRNAGIELGKTYPKPIVDHNKARELALTALKQITSKKEEEE